MRINEVTDAQGQLELLRTIIDNTWSAVAQQAEQERRADAERKAQAKLKPRAKKSGKRSSIRIPPITPPPPKKPQDPLVKQPPIALGKPNPTTNLNALSTTKPIPTVNQQPKQMPTSTEINPKLAPTPYPKPLTTTPLKAQNALKLPIPQSKL